MLTYQGLGSDAQTNTTNKTNSAATAAPVHIIPQNLCYCDCRLNGFVRSALGVSFSNEGHGDIMGTVGEIVLPFPPAAVSRGPLKCFLSVCNMCEYAIIHSFSQMQFSLPE